jgi:D-alanyl-D-alanine carboxypeptidase
MRGQGVGLTNRVRVMRLGIWTLAASVAVAVAATAPPAGASGAGHGQPSSALSRALRQLVSLPGGPPGAIALVQVGGHTQIITAGVGDVTTKVPIDPDDTVRIASVSKAFSGAVALSLVSQKKLKLTDTIGQRLPQLPKAWYPVTLREMLDHTSRLPDYIKSDAFLDELRKDPLVDLTPTQLLGYVADEGLTPGHGYDYSDTDNIVVGLMAEAVTGQPYEASLADEVAAPLGLTKTYLPPNVELPIPYVHGYKITPGVPPEDLSEYLNPALAWASGGMLSTPSELNTFMRAYVRGAFTNASTRQMQFTFVPGDSGPPGPGANAAGLGIFRYQTSCGTVYGHTGNFPGYTIFAAATSNGQRSAEVIVNTQLNDKPATPPFTLLRQIDGLAVCSALQ